MAEDRQGQVVTFYSFKGGAGRTMALANVAWILAAAGKRVLVADWDLESPGLHRFFHPFMDPHVFENQGGVINLIQEYEDQSLRNHPQRPANWPEEQARAHRFAFPLSTRFASGGELYFLSAGRQNQDYRVSVGGLDWDAFFESRNGSVFFAALRASMKRDYDYTLIDSRTGLSDFADICTLHLPDTLVDCFTLSEQGIDGAAQVARRVSNTYRTSNIRVLPVPMRVDQDAEKEKVDAGRAVAMQRFGQLPLTMTDDERSRYWAAVEVPYRAFYAFEETLATFADRPGAPNSLLSSYERLTGYLTNGAVSSMPAMDEGERRRGLSRFERRLTALEEEITLRYAPQDQVWAEWIGEVLRQVDVRVNDPWRYPNQAGTQTARTMTLLSPANERAEGGLLPGVDSTSRPSLAVYLAAIPSLPAYPAPTSAHIHGRSDQEAVRLILQLVGMDGKVLEEEVLKSVSRFPGAPPAVSNAPIRNPRFTGRENDLRQLREELNASRRTVVLPVALQGMGGIGKTQLALEYSHRFQAAYDVIWWITSDPPQFIDAGLGDLGSRLRLPDEPRVQENTRAVLNALSKGEPYGRWLIVFDNADNIEAARPLLPEGPGHVLLTSRNLQWRDRTTTMPIDVFARRESITHLQRRVSDISTEDANRVAEALGDLPIAISAASAWLTTTGTPVGDYLEEIRQRGARAVPAEGESSVSVQTTWDLSLDRLQERSPGAYRLLQLCSVLAPDIAQQLVYGDEMGGALRTVSARSSERMERGKLVQDITRLALLTLDAQRIHVHRLLQHVVRDRMSEDELREARHAMHVVLAAARPRGDVDDPDFWGQFRLLWPHLEVSEATSCPDEAVRELLVDRVRYLWLRGAYVQGEETARRIEETWTALLPTLDDQPEAQLVLHRQLLSLRFNLANMLREQGLFEESCALNEAVLADQAKMLGDKSPYTLMTSTSLSADFRALGRYEEALERDQRTYEAWARDYGDDYPRTLSARNNLASSMRLIGDFRAAEEHDWEIYQRRRLVLGPQHPYTLHSASMLGRDLREAGEYERSVDLLRDVLNIYISKLGEDARDTLNARANLAVSLRSAGRADEATDLLETAYERLLENLGTASPDTLACRLSRASNILVRGDLEHAKREIESVERVYESRLGRQHPHTITCVNNMAVIERTAGSLTEALQLAELAAERYARALPQKHPYILAARMNAAVFISELGEADEALPALRELHGQLAEQLGDHHPDALRCEANLALVLAKVGRAGQDVDEVDLERRLKSRFGSSHPAVKAFQERDYLHRILDPHPY